MLLTQKCAMHLELGDRLLIAGTVYEIVKVPAKDPIGNFVLWMAHDRETPTSFTIHVHPMLIMEVHIL